jgi:hypothetical protein
MLFVRKSACPMMVEEEGMRRRREAIITRIYGLLFGLSMLLFTLFLSGCSPKKAFIPF